MISIDSKEIQEGYEAQKNSSLRRGLQWGFTKETWYETWSDSNLWHLKGTKAGQYGLFIVDKSKPFSPSNCQFIKKPEDIVKAREALAKTTINRKGMKFTHQYYFRFQGLHFDSLASIADYISRSVSTVSRLRQKGEVTKWLGLKPYNRYHSPHGVFPTMKQAVIAAREEEDRDFSTPAIRYRFHAPSFPDYWIEEVIPQDTLLD